MLALEGVIRGGLARTLDSSDPWAREHSVFESFLPTIHRVCAFSAPGPYGGSGPSCAAPRAHGMGEGEVPHSACVDRGHGSGLPLGTCVCPWGAVLVSATLLQSPWEAP